MADECVTAATRTPPEGREVYDRGAAVCVIGAGASGLNAIKNLREAGFEVDCYERETGVGGAWNRRHDRSPVYAGAHLVTSKPLTQFPDFPMPDDWPDYPHHSQLLAYLERYADHFGLRAHIWFGTEVARVEPVGDGRRWDVTIRGSHGGQERTLRYDAVVVAVGHNRSPRWPEIPGLADFRGEVLHASAYSDAAQLRGRKVLVVGGGDTGCDIAVEAARQAVRCWHSTRRGYWYLPRYALGRPTDQAGEALRWLRLPRWLRRWLFARLLRATVGDVTRFGLPRPDHKLYDRHPVTGGQLIDQLGQGAVTAVPDVSRFTRDGVEFTDGTTADPDLVVLATGYRPVFEFADPELLRIDADGYPALRLRMFSRTHPTLAVAGLVRPAGGLFPVVHWQTVTIARWLRLRAGDPQRAAALWARRGDRSERRLSRGRGVAGRDRLEVDHVAYLRALERLLDGLEAA